MLNLTDAGMPNGYGYTCNHVTFFPVTIAKNVVQMNNNQILINKMLPSCFLCGYMVTTVTVTVLTLRFE